MLKFQVPTLDLDLRTFNFKLLCFVPVFSIYIQEFSNVSKPSFFGVYFQMKHMLVGREEGTKNMCFVSGLCHICFENVKKLKSEKVLKVSFTNFSTERSTSNLEFRT